MSMLEKMSEEYDLFPILRDKTGALVLGCATVDDLTGEIWFFCDTKYTIRKGDLLRRRQDGSGLYVTTRPRNTKCISECKLERA